jgi:hypothetical protein
LWTPHWSEKFGSFGIAPPNPTPSASASWITLLLPEIAASARGIESMFASRNRTVQIFGATKESSSIPRRISVACRAAGAVPARTVTINWSAKNISRVRQIHCFPVTSAIHSSSTRSRRGWISDFTRRVRLTTPPANVSTRTSRTAPVAMARSTGCDDVAESTGRSTARLWNVSGLFLLDACGVDETFGTRIELARAGAGTSLRKPRRFGNRNQARNSASATRSRAAARTRGFTKGV